ncbi:HAD family hydrolase [Amycolatopsis dongchuanensis]|uniref:Haloacid dehalogenase-like hydrolase n=1 Tax=Amycolatopsis dongchuanensis TaxID=1070866 RepID=A0ABP8VQX5_9PSEU
MVAREQSAVTLVLWDIDHTLIETRGVGRAIYDRAFPAATGRRLEQLAQISGRTELDIMAESLRINGIEPTEGNIANLAAALVQGYEHTRDELADKGRTLPGAKEALQSLAADARFHQAVLTGNLREVARIKLEVFGLNSYLDLDSSSYGDDDASRSALVTIAQQRAREHTGQSFDNAHTVLIGDTPNDIQAALTAGVRVIGVASGKSTTEDLREAGARDVLEDLRQIEALRVFLGAHR